MYFVEFIEITLISIKLKERLICLNSTLMVSMTRKLASALGVCPVLSAV